MRKNMKMEINICMPCDEKISDVKKRVKESIEQHFPFAEYKAKVVTVKEVKTVTEVIKFIKTSKGKFFSVKFVKRTDGTVREMVCRTGVKSHLVENPSKPGIDFEKNNLISVFDTQKNEYRAIPIEGIIEFKMGGTWFDIIH